MISPDSNDNEIFSKYNVQIGEGKGIVIGDNPHVEQHFYDTLTEPQVDLVAAEATYRQQVVEAYKWLNFSGFDNPDLSLTNVPLEDVFVRLTLTIKQVIREPIQSEKSNQAEQREGKQRERVVIVQQPIELGQALGNHLLIVGEPGIGKSTLLRWLAVTFAQGRQRELSRVGPSSDADRLPVLVELGRLPGHYVKPEGGEIPNWLDFLPKYLPSQLAFTNTLPQLLTQALADGRCLLIFDGLDEIADRQARMRLARSLVELARLSPGNRVIIGSRPAGVSESEGALHPQFQRCQIERFTPEDIQRFIRFWYALDHRLTPEQQREAADALYARLQSTPATLRLASTPLISTILVLIWRNEGGLPERRVDLYERCCCMLIEHWEASHDLTYQGVLANMDWEDHLHLLTPLAYTIHSQEQRTSATKEELLPLLARSLQIAGYSKDQAAATREAKHFLNALGLRSGLLQYMGDDRYGFPHLTFQEYLAARYIAAQSGSDYIDLVMTHLHESWWQQVHLLTIAHLGSKSAGAIKASALILTILRVYTPPSRIWRSRSLIGQFFPQVQLKRRIAWILAREFELAAKGYLECAPDGTTAEVRTILSIQAMSLMRDIDSDWYCRHQQDALLTTIFQLLQHLDKELVVKALLEMPDDEEGSFRLRTVRFLGQVGVSNEVVVTTLLKILHYFNRGVQESLIASLGQMGVGNEIVVAILLDMLHAEDYFARRDGARLLGQMGVGNEAVATALLEMLRDKDQYVRGYAVASLGQVGVGNEAVVTALLDMLHDHYREVQKSAIASLGQVGVGNEAVATALLEMLRDKDQYVRGYAVASLGQVGVGNEAVVTALLEMLHDHYWEVQKSVIASLEQVGVGNEVVVTALLDMLHAEYRFARQDGARLLGQVEEGNEVVVRALLEVLYDKDRGVREAAIASLGQVGVGNRAVVRALLDMLHDKDKFIRKQVAASLGQVGVGNEAVMRALLDMLRDNNWYARSQAAASLGQVGVGNEAVVRALVEILRNEDWYARRQAMTASLEQMEVDNEVAVTALLDMLQDDNWYARRQAARLLGQVGVGNEAVVTALLDMLHDHYWEVQEAAAASLGQVGVGNEAVVRALLDMLHDKDIFMRNEAAIASLGQVGVGNEAVVTALLEILHNEDWHALRQAARLLGQVGVGNEAVVTALLDMLHDHYWEVREAAIASLGQMGAGNEAVVTALLEMLHDKDSPVWRQAIASLGQVGVGNEAVVTALLEMLRHEDQFTQEAAIASLGQVGVGNEAVVTALLKRLRHKSRYMREQTVENLGQVRVDNEAVMTALLEIENSFLRKAAAQLLGQVGVGNEEAVTALLETLYDGDDSVRRQAAASLGQMGVGNEAVAKVLLEILHEEDWDAQEYAVACLGRLEVEDTIQWRRILIALNRRLNDFDLIDKAPITLDMSPTAFASIQQLLNGRPIPGYQWVPSWKRRARRLQLKRVTFCLGMTALIVLIGLAATWLLGVLDPNSFLVRFLAVLAGIVAFAAAVAHFIGRTLRGPWELS